MWLFWYFFLLVHWILYCHLYEIEDLMHRKILHNKSKNHNIYTQIFRTSRPLTNTTQSIKRMTNLRYVVSPTLLLTCWTSWLQAKNVNFFSRRVGSLCFRQPEFLCLLLSCRTYNTKVVTNQFSIPTNFLCSCFWLPGMC